MIELAKPRSFKYLHNDWSKPYIHMVNGDDQIIHGRQEPSGKQNKATKSWIGINSSKNKNRASHQKIDPNSEMIRNFGKIAEVQMSK